MNNKKGISTIVATVLIVLITVAAVTILWAAISPMLDITDTSACVGVATKYEVDSNGDFSYAVDAGSVKIRVVNNGDSEATSLRPVLNVDGDTITLDDVNTGSVVGADGTMSAPTANGAAVITVTGLTLTSSSKISASVSPILTIEGKETTCSGATESDIVNNLT
jgi:hypothetical protein